MIPLTSVEAAESSAGPVLFARGLKTEDVRITPRHQHSRGQLLGTYQGLLSIDSGDNQWVLPVTHAIWLPPHVEHGLRSHGPFSGWSVYVAEPSCAGLSPHPHMFRLSGLLREAVLRALSWKTDTLDAANLRLAGVILDEIRVLPGEPLGLSLPHDSRARRIALALSNQPADSRSLEEWAQWAAIAPRTLRRRFVTETGFSFIEWRQRIRLLRALELLAAGVSVTGVALELGYENVSAFISVFKRVHGVTPGRYFLMEASPRSRTEPAG